MGDWVNVAVIAQVHTCSRGRSLGVGSCSVDHAVVNAGKYGFTFRCVLNGVYECTVHVVSCSVGSCVLKL